MFRVFKVAATGERYLSLSRGNKFTKSRWLKVGRTFKHLGSALNEADKHDRAFILNDNGFPVYARGLSITL